MRYEEILARVSFFFFFFFSFSLSKYFAFMTFHRVFIYLSCHWTESPVI